MQCLWMYPGHPLQRVHVLWTVTDLLNCKAPLPLFLENSTKFREELQRRATIHNLTSLTETVTGGCRGSSSLWLSGGFQTGQMAPGRKVPWQGKRMARASPQGSYEWPEDGSARRWYSRFNRATLEHFPPQISLRLKYAFRKEGNTKEHLLNILHNLFKGILHSF